MAAFAGLGQRDVWVGDAQLDRDHRDEWVVARHQPQRRRADTRNVVLAAAICKETTDQDEHCLNKWYASARCVRLALSQAERNGIDLNSLRHIHDTYPSTMRAEGVKDSMSTAQARTGVVVREVAVAKDLDHDAGVEVRQRPLLRHADDVRGEQAGQRRLMPQDVLHTPYTEYPCRYALIRIISLLARTCCLPSNRRWVDHRRSMHVV